MNGTYHFLRRPWVSGENPCVLKLDQSNDVRAVNQKKLISNKNYYHILLQTYSIMIPKLTINAENLC